MPTPVNQHIFARVAAHPAGKGLSYGQIALLCGRPRASRIVGAAVANGPPGLPYHRVVYQDGSLCRPDVFGGPQLQRRRLESEGVTFTADGRVRMELHRFRP